MGSYSRLCAVGGILAVSYTYFNFGFLEKGKLSFIEERNPLLRRFLPLCPHPPLCSWELVPPAAWFPSSRKSLYVLRSINLLMSLTQDRILGG